MKKIALIFTASGILILPAFVNHVEAVDSGKQPFAAIARVPERQNFRAHLTGDEEVPKKETLGAGDATF